MGETRTGCLEELSHESYTRSYFLTSSFCLILCNLYPISSSPPHPSSSSPQELDPVKSFDFKKWMGRDCGHEEKSTEQIKSRTTLSECGVTREPMVYAPTVLEEHVCPLQVCVPSPSFFPGWIPAYFPSHHSFLPSVHKPVPLAVSSLLLFLLVSLIVLSSLSSFSSPQFQISPSLLPFPLSPPMRYLRYQAWFILIHRSEVPPQGIRAFVCKIMIQTQSGEEKTQDFRACNIGLVQTQGTLCRSGVSSYSQ